MPRSPKLHKPEFLVDRSLGRHTIPQALRSLSYTVHTLDSLYGEAKSQQVLDQTWLEEAGNRGFIVLSKDDAIRRNRLEFEAVRKFAVKLFVLTTARMTGNQQRDRIVSNIHRIVQQARKPGPYIYGIYEKRLTRLWP